MEFDEDLRQKLKVVWEGKKSRKRERKREKHIFIEAPNRSSFHEILIMFESIYQVQTSFVASSISYPQKFVSTYVSLSFNGISCRMP